MYVCHICVLTRSQCKMYLYFICRFWQKTKKKLTVEALKRNHGLWSSLPIIFTSCDLGLPSQGGISKLPPASGDQGYEGADLWYLVNHLNRSSTDTVMREKFLEKVCFLEF